MRGWEEKRGTEWRESGYGVMGKKEEGGGRGGGSGGKEGDGSGSTTMHLTQSGRGERKAKGGSGCCVGGRGGCRGKEGVCV